MMDMTVILATYNRREDLMLTLDHLARQDARGLFQFEVVVADNNSNDGTSAAVEVRRAGFPVPLRGIFEPRQGKSYALNTAIASATAEILVFTDDDCRMDESWLLTLWQAFQSYGADGIGGPVIADYTGIKPAWFGPELERQAGIVDHGPERHRITRMTETLIGPNCAYRRKVFETLGGYDINRLGNSEDADLFLRAMKAGFRLWYLPDLKVYNRVDFSRWTKKAFKRRFWNQGRAIAFGVQEEQQGKTFLRVPLWMVRYVFLLTLQSAYELIKGDVRQSVWLGLQRYFYLGAIFYCLADCIQRKPLNRGRPSVLPLKP